ncbi:MAG TPA: VOC family protein [Methylomirabilota bacterium]|jgi:glyoxylase I family protein|nr:VOC family protein [Methylomirabilota bacterium]
MSAPAHRPPLEVLELDHVVLRVRDQVASQRFYTEVLGLALDHVNEAARLVQLRAGRHLIDLLPLSREEAAPEPAGLDHVCLAVRCADLPRLVEWLRARGVPIDGEVSVRRGAFGEGESIYIRDPDGYRLELKPRAGGHS